MKLHIHHLPELDHVGIAIKRIMLTYPGQFSCRMDVLAAIFLHPTDNELVDGLPDLTDFGPLQDQMNFSDLDAQVSPADLVAANSTEPGASYYAGKVLNFKRLRQDRELIAKYIDVLAVEHTRGENHPKNTKLTKTFRANACLLDNVDVQALDKDWALAAEEVVTAAVAGAANELGMYSPFYNHEAASPALIQLHSHLTGYLDKLDHVTGTKARLKSLMELTNDLISEVLTDKVN